MIVRNTIVVCKMCDLGKELRIIDQYLIFGNISASSKLHR